MFNWRRNNTVMIKNIVPEFDWLMSNLVSANYGSITFANFLIFFHFTNEDSKGRSLRVAGKFTWDASYITHLGEDLANSY
jgi:hypothetical protein